MNGYLVERTIINHRRGHTSKRRATLRDVGTSLVYTYRSRTHVDRGALPLYGNTLFTKGRANGWFDSSGRSVAPFPVRHLSAKKRKHRANSRGVEFSSRDTAPFFAAPHCVRARDRRWFAQSTWVRSPKVSSYFVHEPFIVIPYGFVAYTRNSACWIFFETFDGWRQPNITDYSCEIFELNPFI